MWTRRNSGATITLFRGKGKSLNGTVGTTMLVSQDVRYDPDMDTIRFLISFGVPTIYELAYATSNHNS